MHQLAEAQPLTSTMQVTRMATHDTSRMPPPSLLNPSLSTPALISATWRGEEVKGVQSATDSGQGKLGAQLGLHGHAEPSLPMPAVEFRPTVDQQTAPPSIILHPARGAAVCSAQAEEALPPNSYARRVPCGTTHRDDILALSHQGDQASDHDEGGEGPGLGPVVGHHRCQRAQHLAGGRHACVSGR